MRRLPPRPARRVGLRLATGLAALLVSLLLPAAVVTAQEAAAPSTASVAARRAAILEVARSYAEHEWVASAANTLHGPDVDGVHVDTPDVSARDDGFHTDGRTNVGVPYKWGGFSSLDEFDAAVADGQPAGQLTDGTNLDDSRYAVGVDCSGFVARCWDLPFKQSTRSLGRLCYELDSWQELAPGDLINKYDAHAQLFVGFEDEARTKVRVVEATLPRVLENVYPVEQLAKAGFRPFRYKPLDGRWAAVEPGPVRLELPAGGAFEEDPDAAAPALDALPDGLAAARAGDWTRYRLVQSGRPGVVEVERVLALAGDAGEDALVLQGESRLAGASLQTQETHPATATLVDRLLAVTDEGQPLDRLDLVSTELSRGHWVAGEQRLPATRARLEFDGQMTARSQVIPLTVILEAVFAEGVALEGVVLLRRSTGYELPQGAAWGIVSYELAASGGGDATS